MQQMVDGLQSSMRLLVASVRSPDDIVALASQARLQALHSLNHLPWSLACTRDDAVCISDNMMIEGERGCAGLQHLHNLSRLCQPAVSGATDVAGGGSV